MNISLKKLLPYLLALPIFYLATLSLFYPELLQRKTLRQTDIVQFEGMKKMSIDYAAAHGGETALWNVGMFSGFPEFLMSGTPSGGFDWLEAATAGFISSDLSAHVFFRCVFCAWAMLLCFRIPPYMAIFGALAFGFNTYGIVTLEAGHFTKMWAIAYACLVLGGIRLAWGGQRLLGLGIFLAGFVMELRANHYQITFYLGLACVVYAISELVRAVRDGKVPAYALTAVLLLAATGLGLATQTARLWMTYEYTPHSTRGNRELAQEGEGGKSDGLDKGYAFSWSQGKMETFTLLIPYLYGGNSHEVVSKDGAFYQTFERLAGKAQAQQLVRQKSGMLPLYHGEQPFTSGPVYAGAILCFLFVLGLLALPGQERWWMLAAALLTMAIAWGSNFQALNYFLFDYIPGFNRFRSPSMALSMTIMVMTVGGMMGLKEAIEGAWGPGRLRQIGIAFGATGGLALLFALSAGMMDVSRDDDASMVQRMFGTSEAQVVNAVVGAFEEERVSLARNDGFRSFGLVLLAAALLWAAGTGRIKAAQAVLAIGLLMSLDVWLVDRRYLYAEKFVDARKQASHKATAADLRILKDQDPHYRVLDFQNTFNQANTSYFHKTIGGYFAAKLGRYQDLIERELQAEMQRFAQGIQSGNPDFSQLPALNMLNAKYFKFGDAETQVLQNPQALGVGWFVEEVKEVQSAEEEMRAFAGLDPAKTAVVDRSKFEVGSTRFQPDSLASVSLSHFDNRKVVYETRHASGGLAVFSEVYYPEGWEVAIDGQPARMIRANYVLRAVEVPAGKHTVSFEFKPASYLTGSAITRATSAAALLFALGVLAFAGWQALRRENA